MAPKRRTQARLQDERHWDGVYRAQMRALGASSWKIEPKHIRGWPDAFIAPDIFIEFKYITWFSNARIEPQKHFEPLQKSLLSELSRKRAQCFAGIFWWFGDEGGYVQTLEWEAFMQAGRIDRHWVRLNAHPLEDIKQHVSDTWEMKDGRPSIRLSAEPKVRLADRFDPHLANPT